MIQCGPPTLCVHNRLDSILMIPQWNSSQTCSLSVAVAAINGDLEAFVKWYVDTHQLPKFTTLATLSCPQAGEEKVEFLDDHEVGSQVHPRETYPLLDPLWHTEKPDLI